MVKAYMKQYDSLKGKGDNPLAVLKVVNNENVLQFLYCFAFYCGRAKNMQKHLLESKISANFFTIFLMEHLSRFFCFEHNSAKKL